MRRILLILLMVVTLSGCYKNELFHTIHTDSGLILLEVIPPVLEDGEVMPDSYTIEVNGVEGIVEDGVVTFLALVEPGEYDFYIYNETDAISMSGSVATAVVENGVAQLSDSHIYYGTGVIIIDADNNATLKIETIAITRKLNIDIAITEGDIEDIESIDMTLSGIACGWNCATNSVLGEAVSVSSSLEMTAVSRAETTSLTGSLYLLGVNGSQQQLDVVIHYKNGHKQSISSDLSSDLTGFNDDKTTAYTLQSSTKVLSEISSSGVITDWVVSDDSYGLESTPSML